MAIDQNFEEAIDQLDAAVFTGPGLTGAEACDYFDEYLQRWQRTLDNTRRIEAEEKNIG